MWPWSRETPHGWRAKTFWPEDSSQTGPKIVDSWPYGAAWEVPSIEPLHLTPLGRLALNHMAVVDPSENFQPHRVVAARHRPSPLPADGDGKRRASPRGCSLRV